MNRRVELAVYSAFFLSGVAGLVYQVAWSRYLGILLGGSGAAAIIVLATFMGGLGAGAWLFGNAADREGSKVKLYAWLELGIGAWGGLYPFLFPYWTEAFRAAATGSEPGSATALSLKALAAVASILPGTLLMGGTLPVLGKFLIKSLSLVGDRVAKLYFINSVGAVAGSIVAGFWLIRHFGLDGSMFLAAGVNLFVALIAFSLAGVERSVAEAAARAEEKQAAKRKQGKKGKGSSKKNKSAEKAAAPEDNAEVYPSFNATIALWVIAISGAVSMMYEVVWIRMLALAFGSSTYTFSLVVAAFILGISIGSFILAFKKDDRGYYEILGLCELFIGVALLATLPVFMMIPYWLNQAKGVLAATPESFPFYQAFKFALGFAVMLPPTILIGMTLPAASKVVAREMSTLGRRVGSAFAVNTFGAIVGAVLGGVVVMPALGIRGALLVGVTANVALGLAVLLTVPRKARRVTVRPATTVAVFAAGAMALLVAVPGIKGNSPLLDSFWNDRVLQLPIFRELKAFRSYPEYLDYIGSGETLYHKDSLNASVSVMRWEGGKQTVLINGKPDASMGPPEDITMSGDVAGNMLLPHIPLLAHPDPKDVLIVGAASGVTSGAVLAHEDVNLVTAEIMPEMFEVAKFFDAGNRRFYDHENSSIIIEDARAVLALSPREYDVIITQPSNPWFGGNTALFTTEFYELCRSRLKKGGFLVQWMQIYEMEDEVLWQIFRTLQREFPYITIWETGSTNLALVCSVEPFSPDLARMRERFGQPKVQEDMRLLGLDSFEALLQLQVADMAGTGADLAGPGRTNSDIHPYLEFDAPLGFYLAKAPNCPEEIDQRSKPAGRETLWLARWQATPEGQNPEPMPAERWRAAYEGLRDRHSLWPRFSDWILDRWMAEHPGDPWPAFYDKTRQYYYNDTRQPLDTHAKTLAAFSGPSYEPLVADKVYQSRYLRVLENYFLSEQTPAPIGRAVLESTLEWLRSWPAEKDSLVFASRRLRAEALLLGELGRHAEAAALLEPALKEEGGVAIGMKAGLAFVAAEARLNAGEPAKAAQNLAGYMRYLEGGHPRYVNLAMDKYADYAAKGDLDAAAEFLAFYLADDASAGLDTRARGLLAGIEMARSEKK